MVKKSSGIQASAFPPYGHMHNLWMWDVQTRRVPDGLLIDGIPATARQWTDYVRALVLEVADFLWPMYNPQTQDWEGRAVQQMLPLTLADLALMEKLRPKLLEAVSLTVEKKRLDHTHQSMFEQEDEARPGMPLYPTLDPYLKLLGPDDLSTLKDAIKKKLLALGPAPLRFKEHFQRPRAYQMAFMLGNKFNYEYGRSAVSPALVSGHAMQGLIGRCGAYVANKLMLERTAGAVEGLMQYAVEVGDRRVFAGVHYPSDNLASWYCSLRMCDTFFGAAGSEAKMFMWAAIQMSSVYGAMTDAVKEDTKSPYAEPLALLKKEADRRPKGIE